MKRKTFIILLGLAVVASAMVAQTEREPRQERRLKVVFSGDSAGEQQVWVESEESSGELIIAGEHDPPLAFGRLLHPRAYLGVQMIEITVELREHFGAPSDAGVLISAIEPDSPAATAGIMVGDVLTTIDGETVARNGQVIRKIGSHETDETVTLEIVRDRRSVSLAATLDERPRARVDLAPMFWTPGDDARRILRLPDSVIEIERGDLDEAFTELHERLESPEWQGRLREMTSRRQGLEERIRELEERLQEMEERLEKEPE